MRSITLVAVLGFSALAMAQSAPETPSEGSSQSRAYVARLLDALRTDDSFKVRLQAAVLLGRSTEAEVTDALIEALRSDPHYTVRAAAATALANLGEPRAIPHVVRRAAADEDAFVREEAGRALQAFERSVALPHVVAAFDTHEAPGAESIRQWVVEYLIDEELDPSGERVLERALGDRPEIASVVSEYLIELEQPDEALEILAQAIRDKEPTVRRGAVEVLERLNSEAATAMIRRVYERDIEVEEVKAATRAALRARRDFVDVDAIVLEAGANTEKHARGRALKLLGVLGGERATEVLKEALDDSDIYIRGNAVLAMQWLGSREVVESLQTLERSPENERIMHLIRNTLKKLRQAEEPTSD